MSQKRGQPIVSVRISNKMAVNRRISQLRRTIDRNTQLLRKRSIRKLEEIFKIATSYACGEIKTVTEDGKKRDVSIAERQMWARIAAYTAQTINSVAETFDQVKIDRDLDQLEKFVNETVSKVKAKGPCGETRTDESSSEPAERQS